MRITSNIKGVIRQMERLKANIPIAVKRAMLPMQWKGRAEATARAVITPLAKPEEVQFIDAFIATVSAMPLGDEGFSLQMHAPQTAASQRALDAAENNQIAGLNFGENQTLGDLVRQWVETPFTNRDDPLSGKDIQAEQGGKDFNKSDDQITNDLMWILTGAKSSPSVDAARASLLPRLAAFMQASMAGRLHPQTADLWLRLVLATWAEMVRRAFPGILRQELHALQK